MTDLTELERLLEKGVRGNVSDVLARYREVCALLPALIERLRRLEMAGTTDLPERQAEKIRALRDERDTLIERLKEQEREIETWQQEAKRQEEIANRAQDERDRETKRADDNFEALIGAAAKLNKVETQRDELEAKIHRQREKLAALEEAQASHFKMLDQCAKRARALTARCERLEMALRERVCYTYPCKGQTRHWCRLCRTDALATDTKQYHKVDCLLALPDRKQDEPKENDAEWWNEDHSEPKEDE